MKRLILVSIFVASAVFAAASAFATPLSFSFLVLPAGGAVSGAPGSTVGWGYDLTNTDLTSWLEMTGVGADPFSNGTGSAFVFDLPILAPGASISVPYDAVNGLFELTWDASAPIGFVNSGLFSVSGEFWDRDPLLDPNNAVSMGLADDQRGAYSAIVTRQGPDVPEPGTLLLLGCGLVALARVRSRQRR